MPSTVLRTRLAIGSALLAVGASTLVILPSWGKWWAVAGVAALLIIALGILIVVCAFGRRGSRQALLRLDHFLPFLRKKFRPPGKPALLTRAARRVLPRSWFFDPETGRQGWIRRRLQKFGASVVSAPFRRVCQAFCFLLFLWLFFYVCWPYDARPAASGVVSTGWVSGTLDQETGEVRLTRGDEPAEAGKLVAGSRWYVAESPPAQAPESDRRVVGAFTVTARDDLSIRLSPATQDFGAAAAAFLLASGPWELHETEPGRWPSHYADNLAAKEKLPAELFLVIDPLVAVSTAIASRSWVWSLVFAAIILLVCLLVPRGFCGYLCPLGTLIDLFDWAVGKRVKRFRVGADGWWVHIKYYLLGAVLVGAVFGVLLSGFVAAIPVITRGLLFLGEPIQSGVQRGWHLVPPMNAGHLLSVLLFLGVLGLGFLRPRFWCRYVCPSGAVFSLGNLFRVTERKVESSCIHCNKCVDVCPFDAIKPDFTTRVTDCTLCQTCGGVCPSHSIKFVERWNVFNLEEENAPPTGETRWGRRGFVSLLSGTAAALAGGSAAAAATKKLGANLEDPDAWRPVRPPGSVPEQEFLQMCIRCGECFKACPNSVLQPLGFRQGLEGLWTPYVNADWAGCESSCNACGQVCPTGAIRALPLEEKKVARMGLAFVDEKNCLPFAGREACQLCVDECAAAGYDALEFVQTGTETDAEGRPVEGSGFLSPVVLPDRCVGCGLCQTRCYGINVEEKGLLRESAIVIEAGRGREDRLMEGSYRALRKAGIRERNRTSMPSEFRYQIGPAPSEEPDDPFGL